MYDHISNVSKEMERDGNILTKRNFDLTKFVVWNKSSAYRVIYRT